VRTNGLGMAKARVWAVRKEVMRSDDDGSMVSDVICVVLGMCRIVLQLQVKCNK